MHCWPFSILDNLDCCQWSWSQTTSRVRPRCSRMYCISQANPLRTTVTSFAAPTSSSQKSCEHCMPDNTRFQQNLHSPNSLCRHRIETIGPPPQWRLHDERHDHGRAGPPRPPTQFHSIVILKPSNTCSKMVPGQEGGR